MKNIQSDVILEFQKSIENMTRLGQEMATLDAQFGRLDQRIDAMRTSLSGLQSQVSRGTDGNIRQSLTKGLNNFIAGNEIFLQQLGSTGLTVQRETLQSIFGKIEVEINEELRKHVRNMNVEIDSSYAKGQKLPISNEDFKEINEEVAKVVKTQIHNLIKVIQNHTTSLAGPESLEGLQVTVGKNTIMAFVNKIKQEILNKLENPYVANSSDFIITKEDLNKAIKNVKEKLLKSVEVEVPDVSSKEITDNIKNISNELERSFTEYVNKTVAGINGATTGKLDVPIQNLSNKVKKIIARELETTVDQLDTLGTVDLGSFRGNELEYQLERVAKALDKKMSNSVQEEIDQIVKTINNVEITPEPKLKRHLVNQINHINNAMIDKIREQVDEQVQSIIQEINEVQSRPKGLNRDAKIQNAGGLDISTESYSENGKNDSTTPSETVSNGNSSSQENSFAGTISNVALESAVSNMMRNNITGVMVGAPMLVLNQAVETFKSVQTEQIKMIQNLMMKDKYNKDENGNVLNSTNMAGVESTVNELQSFIRQQSMFYGTDYHKLYQVGGVASGFLKEPVEMKEFVRVTAQLQALTPGSDPLKIAKGLESAKSQFGLEMSDMEDRVAHPIAAVSRVTNTSVEELFDIIKQSGSASNNTKVDSETAIVMAGASNQSPAIEGTNVSHFYNSIVERLQPSNLLNKMDKLAVDPNYGDDGEKVAAKLQSPDAMKKLQELGLANVTDTGGQLLVPAKELFKSISQKLSGADSLTVRNTADTLFGTSQSSKGAAAMHEVMNTFVKVMQVTDNFNKSQYEKMIMTSLDNPLVNTKRATQGTTIAFDAIVQEMTPAINKVSYALINMADNVAKNAQIFVALGDVLSNVVLGMLMLKGIKWGAGNLGIRSNFESETARTAFLDNMKDVSVDSDFKKLNRQEVAAMQQDPLLNRYVQELNGMSEEQSRHFKDYISEKKVDIKDIPTLFTTMDEAKNWEKQTELTDDEKFDRTRQYNNRLSTRAELASVINPSLLTRLSNSTASQGTFGTYRANVSGYTELTDRMSQMSQGDFNGFEDHLVDRQRNGLPQINDIKSLSDAMDDYQNSQRDAATSARRASPEFGNLSNAVRGMNSALSQTTSLKTGFKQFLKDIPDLGRGALSSIKNLAGGIAKMALEIAGAIGLAQAAKGLSESYLSTDDQRLLAKADDRDNDLKGMVNKVDAFAEGGWSGTRNDLTGMFYSAMNGITSTFGGTPSNFGYIESSGNPFTTPFKSSVTNDDFGMMGEMMNYFKFYGGSQEDFSKWLKEREESGGQTVEEAVAEFNQKSGRGEATKKLRQEAITKQYEAAQLEEKEQKELRDIAKRTYEEKYKKGTADFSSIDTDTVLSRVSDILAKTKDSSQIETLRSLMSGMKTDSDEYIAMRKSQTASMRQVLNDELAIIDQYIQNAKTIMETSDPESQEYQNAKNAYDSFTSARDKVANEGEAEILQEEWNNRQETYQGQVRKVNNSLSRIDLLTQAKELAAAYNMDTQSQEYLDTMKQITLNKLSAMKSELSNLKAIESIGDLSEDQATQVLQLQNQIANEQARIKEYNLASIGLGTAEIQNNNSERENRLLELKLRAGNPDDSSPILRNRRIANAKEEVSEINQVITDLKARLPAAGADETYKINQEIRDLQKQSLQTQLGILSEMKASAGTFNMPDGVQAMSRYQYLTRGNTHNTTTIGAGDVTVNITLPNVTNGMTSSQLQQVGQSIGQGLSVGRVGGLRNQQAMNPINYRS
ncbi:MULTISPECIES: hypothetical protein [Paenibacillus]|uniref:hypothetical protein n=1 Tax=Paenibacillus TaxID=44249 RepID=UPI000B872866|nr:hypothetical protein [Paenibacillus amylolyticus]